MGVGNHSVVTGRFVAYVPIFAVGEIIERGVARRAHQRNYVPRMRHRIRTEDQRIHHAEGRRRHPDSQRQRDYHERRQSGRASQPTDRKSHILQKIFHQRQSSLGSIVLLDPLHAAKLQHRLPSRLDGRQTRAKIFLSLQRNMSLDLFLQPVILRPRRPQVQHSREKPPQRSHG